MVWVVLCTDTLPKTNIKRRRAAKGTDPFPKPPMFWFAVSFREAAKDSYVEKGIYIPWKSSRPLEK